MNASTVVLFGPTACNNARRLRRKLYPERRIIEIPDERNVEHLRAALVDADALIALGWRGETAVPTAPRLRLIQALGAGTDAYDVNAMPAGCTLCNVYEHAVPIAEYVVGAMAALTIGFLIRDRNFRQGCWHGTGRRDGEPHGELAGGTVGLIGLGTIGREIARRAAAMEIHVRAVRRSADRRETVAGVESVGGVERLPELLSAADFVVICCPLTEATRGLLTGAMLARMKPTAYLINVARAEIVDERALYAALRERRIAGAALDVWYRYPADADERCRPATEPFHELDNVLMTPHLSAWTEAMIERRWTKIAANLNALAAGRSLENVVAVR